jgi:hypothetical protein
LPPKCAASQNQPSREDLREWDSMRPADFNNETNGDQRKTAGTYTNNYPKLRRATMNLKNIFANFIAVTALAATLTICAAAQTAPLESEIDFGMIGGAFGQTARLNLVYRGYKDDPSTPSIQVEFTWLNRRGEVIGRSLQTVQPGQGVFSDLNLNPLTRANRVEIIPCVRILTDPARRVDVGGSLEIFDNLTGRTSVYADRNLVIQARPTATPLQSLTRQ